MKLKKIEIRVNGSIVKQEFKDLEVPDPKGLFNLMQKAADMISDELVKGHSDDAKTV